MKALLFVLLAVIAGPSLAQSDEEPFDAKSINVIATHTLYLWLKTEEAGAECQSDVIARSGRMQASCSKFRDHYQHAQARLQRLVVLMDESKEHTMNFDAEVIGQLSQTVDGTRSMMKRVLQKFSPN